MQIVIDIPEKTVNEIKDNAMFAGSISSEILWDVTSAIVNSTPLPKGHGDLKDTKAILGKFDDTYNSKIGVVPDNLAEGFVQCEKLIKTATTLIKADKESEDKA